MIAETLDALAAMDYPTTNYEVHVLADHCTDRTADLATPPGRNRPRARRSRQRKGPGAVGDDRPAARSATVPHGSSTPSWSSMPTPIVAPAFLRAIDAAFDRGAEAVQGQYRVRDPGESTGAGLRAIALASRHHVRPLGRTTLGGSSGLYGNGMAFTRRALADRTWSNHLTEDIELQMELLFDGILVAYAPDAVVEAEMPATLEAAVTQNERWERGRLQLARRYVPRLLRRALDRATRPGRCHRRRRSTISCRRCPSSSRQSAPSPWPTSACPCCDGTRLSLGALVLPGALVRARAVWHRPRGRAAIGVPFAAPRARDDPLEDAVVAAHARSTSDEVDWVRTGRDRGRHVNRGRTTVVLGVPIDDVTLGEAVDRIAAMVETGRATGRVHQVATVNADFVVNAFEDGELRRILRRTDLSIPDGMIVVWATRLLGCPVRERTTGIDLLPATRRAGRRRRVSHRASSAGHPVSPSGRRGSSASGIPARRSRPSRRRAVAPDGTMDVAALQAIRDAKPDIVCVALGNPKQEKWIARHGASVGAPVYIGVGGSLDFLTGVTRRAPAWMQRSGLEWLHRTVSEPRRLARRYARDIRVFVPQVLRQAWRGRRREPAIAAALDMTADGQPW